MVMAADANLNGVLDAAEQTPDGQPILNYGAVYPAVEPYAGKPILAILDAAGAIFHNELNAVIVGSDSCLPANSSSTCFATDPAPYQLYPDRGEPFREFTIAFHDEVKMVQAFPEWYKQLEFTLGSVVDGFAVNYGTGGIGSEIIGNRLGVGPMYECGECKYEEFFLTAWAVGDPAMIVDIPANAGLEMCDPALKNCAAVGPKATKAFYPDDPSNVFHGYLNDRTKVRNIHVGTEHHIFHLHAHQWNFINRDKEADQSNYLDAQALGPGSSFTYEITYGGGGNRNKTAGDSIFHCHFYPHFAQGMWGLWRVHDTFEIGSTLDDTGRVSERGLPDAEICADGAGGTLCGGYEPGTATKIAGGSPVPGVIPIPNQPMAPMPGFYVASIDDDNNNMTPDVSVPFMGYPFYIPGVAGHRPPTPPLDLVADGGLPRHVITEATVHAVQTATDFDKVLLTANGFQLPEEGTLDERVAMAFHGPQASTMAGPVYHDSYWPDGYHPLLHEAFEVNGLPPSAGAPYEGELVGNTRFYAASVIELPVDLNKVGWHFGQQRILVLDEDIQASLDGIRAPEPFVMRANSGDCVDYDHTNLVPSVYQLDDFQVKTPTDVIGQHIHLVKFDVTSADGSGNGWNYEDGTFSPHEVQERIAAFNAVGGTFLDLNGTPTTLAATAWPASTAAAPAPAPRGSAGTSIRAGRATSSPTTTSAPRPTSRPASTARCWSSPGARSGSIRRRELSSGYVPTAARPAGGRISMMAATPIASSTSSSPTSSSPTGVTRVTAPASSTVPTRRSTPPTAMRLGCRTCSCPRRLRWTPRVLNALEYRSRSRDAARVRAAAIPPPGQTCGPAVPPRPSRRPIRAPSWSTCATSRWPTGCAIP